MKQKQTLRSILTLISRILPGLLIFLLVSCSSDDGQMKKVEPVSAEIIQLQGTVQRLIATGSTAALNIGDTVEVGTRIETGATSSLTLQFADQSKMLVAENSSIKMEGLLRSKVTGEVETVIRMDAGSAESRVTKQSGGFRPRYRVVTPAMQLAVRGTVFVVKVDKDSGRSSSMVTQGTVVASAAGEEVELTAGYGTVATVGQPPHPPSALLPSPKFVVPQITQTVQSVWSPVDNATTYRVQVLSGSANDSIVYDRLLSVNEVSLVDLPNAIYLLKVFAIDGEGLEGKAAEQTLVIDVHPLPPLPKSPLDNTVVSRKKIRFAWEHSSEASGYLLQVADDINFSNIVSQVENLPVAIGRISIKFPPGKYYWRIAAINSEKDQGPYAPTQGFVVVAKK